MEADSGAAEKVGDGAEAADGGEEREEEEVRDFAEIGADLPDEEEIVFDSDMKEADASALSTLMCNEEFLARCEHRCGPGNVATMRDIYSKLKEKNVGDLSEAVVTKYGAPHLRPVSILGRSSDEGTADGACWSSFNFLKYAAAEAGSA
mmetsp:Transcript_11510/g.19104  ORF Transcript_11510/g.19104 Transcript_11510/m.19104 type:complete len:149 (-) Transcript_11510:29-475(-)